MRTTTILALFGFVFQTIAFSGLTSVSAAEIVSAYVEITEKSGDYTIMTVPDDKKFIMTDIISYYTGGSSLGINFLILQDTETKTALVGEYSYRPMRDSIHFKSGIPFSPGTKVIISSLYPSSEYMVRITISGYYVDAVSQLYGDFDNDCDVDGLDLAEFSKNYGAVCSVVN